MNPKELQFFKNLKKAIEGGAVQPDELIAVSDALLAVIETKRKELEESLIRLDSARGKEIQTLQKELSEKESALSEIITSVKTDGSKQIEEQVKRLEKELNELSELIPDPIDLSELENKIEEVKKSIPTIPEAKELTGPEIVDLLNALAVNSELQIDASHIKNLPQSVRELIHAGFPETQIKAGSNVTVRKDASGAWVISSTGGGGSGSSVSINGVTVTDPNFIDSASATFNVAGSDVSITVTGGGGSGGNYIVNETPDGGTYGLLAGDVNGVNTQYTVVGNEYVSGTLVVWLNGQKMAQGTDWSETDPTLGTFDFVTAPETDDHVSAMYQSETSDSVYLESVQAGTNITIDNTDPQNPIINAIGAGTGDVSKVGTPVDNQVGVWTGDGTIEGTSGLVFSSNALGIGGVGNVGAYSGSVATVRGSNSNIFEMIRDITSSDSLLGRFVAGNTSNSVSSSIDFRSGTVNNRGQIRLMTSNGTTNTEALRIDEAQKSTFYNGGVNLDYSTASRVPVLDASKNLIASSVTSTELGYVSGVTSAIQTQLDAKLASSAYDDATGAETTTGTSTAKYVSPDGLAGSDYGKRVVNILVSDPQGSAITTGDGKACFRIPSVMNGWNLVGVAGSLSTVSSSGIPTFQVRRSRRSSATARTDADMLTTKLTIDATEFDSVDAAAAVAIDTSNDDVNTGDNIYIDIDVAGTGAKGLVAELIFQLS